MSPGWRLSSDTWVPAVDWSWETRGRSMPTCRKAACTRPEQSHELGPVPPETYASPTCARTKSMTAAAEPVAVEADVDVDVLTLPEPVSAAAASVVRWESREARSAAA